VPPLNRHVLARHHEQRRRNLTPCKTSPAETIHRRKEAPPPRRPGTKLHRYRRRHVAGQAGHFVGILEPATALQQEQHLDPAERRGTTQAMLPRTAGDGPDRGPTSPERGPPGLVQGPLGPKLGRAASSHGPWQRAVPAQTFVGTVTDMPCHSHWTKF
jgi:hypothetical protein